jgi:RND superfamily putative drug exporter
MSAFLYRLGSRAARHPWRVLGAWLLIAVTAFVLNGSVGGEKNDNFRLPGAESQKAADALIANFPQQTVYNAHVVFHSDDSLTRPQTRAAVAAAIDALSEMPHVIDVTDPYDPRGPTVSKDGHTAFTTVAFDIDVLDPTALDVADKATQPARDAGIQVEYDGILAYLEQGGGGSSSELIGIAAAILVLVIAFGSLVAMSLPIAVALMSLLIGTSGIGILSGWLTVPSITTIVGSMLGLGVGIDYALFVLARHRQNLAAGESVPDAAGRANATAGMSVLFAGITVVVAIAGLQVAGIPMLTMMGWGSALIVAVTMLAAVTLLPGLLGLVGRRVDSARIPFVKVRPVDPAGASHTVSGRWAARVANHPARYGLAAFVVLLVLAAPVTALRIGFSDDGNAAPDSTARNSYDLLADGFGPGFNGPLQVVVDITDATPKQAKAALEQVSTALAADRGVAAVSPPAVSPDGDLAVLVTTPTTAPQDAETADLVQRLRHEVLPAATQGSDVEPMVTGGVALQTDVSRQLQHRMVWFLAAVIGLSFILLMLVFRSVLVPLKAAVFNLLSIGASYGVLVAVFQWGWGASALGIQETVPINPLAPMLMFAILFGLSTDYEVFLLSRVREQYLIHGQPRRAVTEAVGSTARVITSAALIMVLVFAAFIPDPDVTTKLFGVGLSVAVLLDVTLVRMVLVPAAMSALGHRAWWLPAGLARILPTVDHDGSVVAGRPGPGRDADEPESALV